ncbi:recombinase family protein [Flavobacterium tructae]|uniref:recombinase family protein n=1 Tax=Flavobacterium tructae TaxID=1114873 RepID=UPI002551EBDB|nr:recombinase family protein [Flavobacterium tructae]MDL2141797.1 recombinase family protein [Flavobacterium tructae]
MRKARYIRVSSTTQNIIRQTVKQHAGEQVFIDVISGAVAFNDRPQAKLLMQAIEDGIVNYLTVESIDRIGRDAFNIQSTIQYFNGKGVNLKVENLGVESLVNGKVSMTFKMISDILANVAELTRNNLREAQAQGIKIAVLQGKYKGRVKGTSASDDEVLNKYKNVVKVIKQHPDLSYRKIASIADVSLGTVQKVRAILYKN